MFFNFNHPIWKPYYQEFSSNENVTTRVLEPSVRESVFVLDHQAVKTGMYPVFFAKQNPVLLQTHLIHKCPPPEKHILKTLMGFRCDR